VTADAPATDKPKPAPPKSPAARKAPVVPAKGPTAESAAKREEARTAARERRIELQRRKAAAERRRKIRNGAIVGGIAVLAAVGIFLAVQHSKHARAAFATLSKAAGCTDVQATDAAGPLSRDHMTPQEINAGVTVTYSTSPPSGGKHYPNPLPKGVYDTPLSSNPKDQPNLYEAVHSLEHGYVDIWYKGLSTDQLASIRQFADQEKVLVIDYPDLPTGTVGMTTWGRLQTCQTYDPKQVQAYIDQYKLKTGPEPTAP